MLKNEKILLLVFTVFILISCTSTGKVWSKYKPNEYAYVDSNGIDPEPMLIKADVKYFCEKVIQSSSGLDKACYVEKTLAQKTNGFIEILMKTPEALIHDIVVVGKVTIESIATVIATRHPGGYSN